ncbi:MAG: sigma-54-dependent Fis family transcriptional regulator [Planctomycetes bacterium]|nr:sigma-54-dependent Fis family transcriptional regulator [Planctomycetota bacterium]
MSQAAVLASKPAPRVLVVDDDADHAEAVAESLERVGYGVEIARGGREAAEALRGGEFEIVVTDLLMRDVDGLEVLRAARQRDPSISVFLLTAHASVDSAVQAMREGAADYLEKPIQLDALRTKLAREVEARRLRQDNLELRRQLDRKFGFESLVGESEAIGRILQVLRNVAPTDATVLILGETGTGKELVAHALHSNSPRRERPFVAVNCAALSEGLIESELFGHEKGSFTGADRRAEGKFEYAAGGTLFLDEVGDMPLTTQAKLLRALESRKIVRVGGNKEIPIDVRVVAATNRPLEQLVKEKKFREDLYFRLHVVTLGLPPLRERVGDVPLLAAKFLHELATQHKRPVEGFTPEVMRALLACEWPGNVRQLKNTIESMVVSSSVRVLDESCLPPFLKAANAEASASAGGYRLEGRSLAEVEADLIQANLKLAQGNREKCAALLGIGERTLYRKLKEYGLR